LAVPAAHGTQPRPDGVYPGSHVHAVAPLPALASAPHARHAVAPSAPEYVSAPQLVQVVVPAAWNVPAAQMVHSPASPAYPASHTQLCTLAEPVTVLPLCSGHASHDSDARNCVHVLGSHGWHVESCAGAYVPASHAVHVPLRSSYPALQVHAVAPGGELECAAHGSQYVFCTSYVPAPHVTQRLSSVPFCTVPAKHATHVSASRRKPASQIQSASEDEPTGADESAMHARHTLLDVAACVVEYVSAGHATHCVGSNASLLSL
jgi:hypothetical protein